MSEPDFWSTRPKTIYVVISGEIIELSTECCYQPDGRKFMVHLSKYGYEFFTLGESAFFKRDTAETYLQLLREHNQI